MKITRSLTRRMVALITVLACTCLASGAEIKVDSLADSGEGSLREAIATASNGDTVVLRAEGVLQLESPITVNRDLTIVGENGPQAHVLSGGGANQIFIIPSGRNVILSGLSFVSGYSGLNGGAIQSEGELVLERVRMENNTAVRFGGAVSQENGTLTVRDSFFRNNDGGNNGGAIFSRYGTLFVDTSGFMENTSGNCGGAFYYQGPLTKVTNTTLALNKAAVTAGGAFIFSPSGTFINVTLTGNTAPVAPQIESWPSSTVIIGNSILEGEGGFSDIEGGGNVTSLGNNMTNGAGASWILPSDVIVADLGLGTPGDFGGMSPTYPLNPGSPAIDAGNNEMASGTDQRGEARFSDGDKLDDGNQVDIGAFEVQMYRVSSLSDGPEFVLSDSVAGDEIVSEGETLTLRAAIEANNAAGGGAISFDPEFAFPARIYLGGSPLEILRNLTIYGPGADLLAVDGNSLSPVFQIGNGAAVTIEQISIENGFGETGAGVSVDSNASLGLQAVSLSGNSAFLAGGGLALLSGEATIFRSTLAGNSAAIRGGALFVAPETFLRLDTSTVSGNSTEVEGGGMAVDGFSVIESTAFVDNLAESATGIHLGPGGLVTMGNSILSGPRTAPIISTEFGAFETRGANVSNVPAPPLTASSDLTDSDPLLGPLDDNGGPTLTHAPLPGSPLINRGASDSAPAIDQRGLDRVRGGTIDIGPVEIQNSAPLITCKIPDPYPADCSGETATNVTLRALVSDVDGDALTITWREGGPEGPVLGQVSLEGGTEIESEVFVSAGFSLGETTVTVEVSDSQDMATCSVSVLVADTVDPIVEAADIEQSTDPESCGASIAFEVFAIDNCSGIDSIEYRIDGIEGAITSPHVFPVGDHVVLYRVTDGAGNVTQGDFLVTVTDETDPVFEFVPDGLQVASGDESCEAAVDFTVLASDDCSGIESIDYSIDSVPVIPGDVFPLGSYPIAVSITDGAGNRAQTVFTVEVVDQTPPVFDKSDPDEPIDITVATDPGFCFAELTLSATATDNCSGNVDVAFSIPDGEEGWQVIPQTYRFPVGITEVRRTATDASGNAVSESFLVIVEDTFLNCVFNISWPNALPLDLEGPAGGNSRSAQVQQFLALTDQARWFRFTVEPGSRVTVLLTDLPANFDIVVYRDIAAEYQRLFNLLNSDDPDEQRLALLGAEFAPESFSPESFSPESFSPESFSPESFSPESFSPESFSPESFSPESFSPESFSPESFSPESFSPESFSPESFSPESFSPESFSPESFSPESFSPESFSPESFSPESFSAAQTSSMIGYSAFPGLANEGVAINTFTRSGEFYIRVKGANGAASGEMPFTLTVQTEGEICVGLQGPDSAWFSTQQPVGQAGGYESLILWDSSRMDGTAEEIAALGSKLTTELAVRPDVNGKVIDLASEPRVQDANDQADLPEFQACPFAKNLVADEIKSVIDAWWAVNPDLKYIVLIGNDEDIPFFRTNDEAFLANQSNYIPPVIDSTHSQSALRYGQILTQDPYGSSCELNLVTGPYPYPELAIGRLVESVADISSQIDNYLATADGILPAPSSGAVTGYDFLWDVALEVEDEFGAALGAGGTVNTLIDDSTVAPADGWTAAELADILLGTRNDLVFLAGHFSTGSTLAADYSSRLTAAQLLALAPEEHFLNSLVFSVGCHSGYNTVDEHAITGITNQPDWAQAFGRMGAIYIAGTGYQYGDTEFIEYSERLYLEFTRNLRRGSGPVSIGEALREAKIKYLEETPLMRGIHEKSLVQVTLFGLPMTKIDVPGERLAPDSRGLPLPITPVPADTVQGEFYGLEIADTTIVHEFSPLQVLQMRNIDVADPESPDAFINTYWYSAKSGLVSNPAEPVRPLETYKVGLPGTLLRGVGFKGGRYADTNAVNGNPYIPLTGAPTTEIRGVYGNFFSEVWFPVQPFTTNTFAALCGGGDDDIYLNVYPSQYLATGRGVLGGTLRKYESMDFRFYYSDNRGETLTLPTGDIIAPALAPAPTIAKVQSEDLGSSVRFDVNVIGLPAVGIHEVWVTYTGIPGSPFHGQWQSLSLDQDGTDSTLWSAELPLPTGAVADDLLYIVQAASGTGLVALSTNLGQYFKVNPDELASRTPTSLDLAPVPGSAGFGEVLELGATLKDGDGNPLTGGSGFAVNFRVGTSKVTGMTDPATGAVSVSLPLVSRPGATTLQVDFVGNSEFEPTTTAVPLLITRQATALTYQLPLPDQVLGSDIVVSLTNNPASGPVTPLKERTVFFLVEYVPELGQVSVGVAVITDFSGRADLGELDLQPGAATVTAFFNGDITLPDGSLVTIQDDLYLPAEPVRIPVIIADPDPGDTLRFDPHNVKVFYRPATGGEDVDDEDDEDDEDDDRKTNRGKDNAFLYHKATIDGQIHFTVPLEPGDLRGSNPEATTVDAQVEAMLSGEVIAASTVQLHAGKRGEKTTWVTKGNTRSEVDSVKVRWIDDPLFDSALVSDAGPRIYTTSIRRRTTWIHYVPVEGTYQTTFPDGTIIDVKDGVVDLDASTGLRRKDGSLKDGNLVLKLGFEVKPDTGQEFVTRFADSTGRGPIVIPVQQGVSFLDTSGRLEIDLETIEGFASPATDAESNLLELHVVIGNEGGPEARFSVRFGDGEAAFPWTRERKPYKQYRP